jgi:hypothetical protein
MAVKKPTAWEAEALSGGPRISPCSDGWLCCDCVVADSGKRFSPRPPNVLGFCCRGQSAKAQQNGRLPEKGAAISRHPQEA